MGDKLRKFRIKSDDNHKNIPRSNVARGMIEAGTGISQKFRDRRERRSKDARNDWQEDWSDSES